MLAIKKKTGAVKAGARPPSYTDRVLVHSLPDQKLFLDITGGTYDLCDDVLASDHRPVALTCALGVDASYSRPKKGIKATNRSSYYYVHLGAPELDLKSPRAAKDHMALDLAHLIQNGEAGVDLEEDGELGEGDEDEDRATVDIRNTASIGGSAHGATTNNLNQQAEPFEVRCYSVVRDPLGLSAVHDPLRAPLEHCKMCEHDSAPRTPNPVLLFPNAHAPLCAPLPTFPPSLRSSWCSPSPPRIRSFRTVGSRPWQA